MAICECRVFRHPAFFLAFGFECSSVRQVKAFNMTYINETP
jgi:hypothetical protein